MEDWTVRRLGQWAGAKDGWGCNLALRGEETHVLVDARAVRHAVPTFLLRLRAFVEWHLKHAHEVKVLCPTNAAVAGYMSRMGLADGLPSGVFEGLPTEPRPESSDVLIPVRQLFDAGDVDELGEKLVPFFSGHSDDVAVFTQAMHMATSELCGNAVEHGRNPLGCYVAAQRYERGGRRTVLSIGDLGVGIPVHMARRYPDLSGDRTALKEAVKLGVTATGDVHRGNGFHWVMSTAQESLMRHATLDVRSGKAQLVQSAVAGEDDVATVTHRAPFKKGTWVTFELGPLPSV
jgi:anti-sigma regulatory factor (Ser/Thr protein kinase)